MRRERGCCHRCGHKSVERAGEALDGRPQYRCLNGSCQESYTKGHQGESWDTKPSPTRRVRS